MKGNSSLCGYQGRGGCDPHQGQGRTPDPLGIPTKQSASGRGIAMAQSGYIYKHGGSWFLRYRDNFTVDGQIIRKQVCKKLADYCDHYRCERDVKDLAEAEIAKVKQSAKTPHPGILFTEYVEQVYLPYVKRTTKPSTYAGRMVYFQRYIKPRAEGVA